MIYVGDILGACRIAELQNIVVDWKGVGVKERIWVPNVCRTFCSKCLTAMYWRQDHQGCHDICRDVLGACRIEEYSEGFGGGGG